LSEASEYVLTESVTHVSDEILAALASLVPQLSSTASALTRQHLEAVVADPSTELLIARLGDAVVGTLTLVTYTIPTGLRARIEDVVVDHAARGHGIGKALTASALELAEHRGARTIDLTSTPTKTAANQLYQNLGFTPRETTTYRHITRSPTPQLR